MADKNANPKYDAIARDMFTALDVSILFPIVFFIDGLQSHKLKARVAVVSLAVGIPVGITAGVVVSPTWGVIAWVMIMLGGWLIQLAIRIKVRADDDVTQRPATWLATTFSVFHYITLINLYHPELHNDNLVRFLRAWIYLIHVIAGTTLVFTIMVMDRLNIAWGCYPPGSSLRDYNLGPCGESPSLPWVDPYPQAICRSDAYEVLSPGQSVPCGPRTSSFQKFGNVFHVTIHMEAVALALYTIACLHAYAVYFTDDVLILKSSASAKASMLYTNLIL